MKKTTFIFVFALLISVTAFSQKSLLQSGPMIGYSEMREVMLWVQTKNTAEVKIQYQNIADENDKHWTNSVITEKGKAFTAHLIADTLEPGRKCLYELYINNKKVDFTYKTVFQTLPIWKWRTEPPEFSFATGGGAYINEEKYDRPGTPYGGDYRIYENIAKKKPDFMLWTGDNVYLKESDWNSKTGIHKRYTHTRSTPEMQELLGTTHNYAIWDDHDFGDNNSDRSFWNKNETLDAFKLFWANLSYGVGDIKGAISYFNWNDCDFFLLDNRFHRSPDNLLAEEKTMLGKEQLQWLKDALTHSLANFKFVVMGGQFLNTSGFHETYSNNGFSKERNDIIEFIHNNKIQNVIFLTGDRHHSELSVLHRAYLSPIYDITVSPLTSGANKKNPKEINSLRVAGSMINKRNFAILKVTGKSKERRIEIKYFDADGKEIYKYEIKKFNSK